MHGIIDKTGFYVTDPGKSKKNSSDTIDYSKATDVEGEIAIAYLFSTIFSWFARLAAKIMSTTLFWDAIFAFCMCFEITIVVFPELNYSISDKSKKQMILMVLIFGTVILFVINRCLRKKIRGYTVLILCIISLLAAVWCMSSAKYVESLLVGDKSDIYRLKSIQTAKTYAPIMGIISALFGVMFVGYNAHIQSKKTKL